MEDTMRNILLSMIGSYKSVKSWWIQALPLILLLGLIFSRNCLAADETFELHPKWLRPGPNTMAQVKLPATLDTSRKLFLRFTHANDTFTDLPLPGDQMSKRVAEVMIRGPLRSGTCRADLVNEEGKLQSTGPKDIRIAIVEKPAISTIYPKIIYPKNGLYDFDILGDNFSHFEAGKIIIRINDVVVDLNKYESDSAGNVLVPPEKRIKPYLVSDWRAIRICGLSLEKGQIGRPLEITVEVDKLVSESKPLALSLVPRYLPRVIAFAVLGLVVALVYLLFIRRMARLQPENIPHPIMACLFNEPQTNTYSLSKLQMVIWGGAAIVAYSYLAASQFLVQWKLGIPNVPDGLPMLLGISATTTALAVGATGLRGSKGGGTVNPGLADFITSGGVFAPERLQFFVWTVLGATTFIAATLFRDPGTASEMANIPDTFNQLMGASSLGYLAGKISRKPGPVIKSISPDDQSEGFRIIGENLSPRAQLLFNGVQVTTRFVPGAGQPASAEFVSELLVIPVEPGFALKPGTQVQISNPDGQCAEWQQSA